MNDFFDYGIADEVHELSNDTAQGNALGDSGACGRQNRGVLTGTLMGGYADDLFNVLYRLEPHKMVAEGIRMGRARSTQFRGNVWRTGTGNDHRSRRECLLEGEGYKAGRALQPGASPLLFGKFLMELGAFVSLEDISSELPSYREEVIGVEMVIEPRWRKRIRISKSRSKKRSKNIAVITPVISTALNALLSYPDRPYGLGDLIGTEYDPGVASARAFPDRQDTGSRTGFALRERAEADRMHQGRSCPRQKMPDLCCVHGEAGCNQPARTGSVTGRHSGTRWFHWSQVHPWDQREAWYERKAPRRYASVRGSSSPGFRGHGLAVGAIDLLRADGILDLHFAAGRQAVDPGESVNGRTSSCAS